MDTRNGVTERLLSALAIRPAAPGLALVAVLTLAAVLNWPMTTVTWFWPTCAAVTVLTVLLNTGRQDVLRRVQGYRHQQRMDTANALLNDQVPATDPEEEITGSIRELGGVVERFGHKLDDLLAEVHTEKSSADQRQRHS
jgi:hypothetical protein